MGIAARQSLWAQSLIRPPFDWSYNAALEQRLQISQNVSKVQSEPAYISTSGVLGCRDICTPVVLWSKPGSIGIIGRTTTSDSSATYWIFDTVKNTLSQPLATIPVGSASNWSLAIQPTIDGRLVVASRYQGKVWTMDEDGSNLEYVGQTHTSWSTKFGIYMYSRYDGTLLVFQYDTTNGPSYIISRDMSISAGAAMNTTYPYSYIMFPGRAVVTGTTGFVSVFDENMSSKLVSNRSVSSYYGTAWQLFVPPGRSGEVLWASESKTTNIGIKTDSPYNNIVTGSNLISGECSGPTQAFLPTGQIFGQRNGQYFLYDYLADTNSFLSTSSLPTTNLGYMLMLPTGKIVLSHYDSNSYWIFDTYDFGFSPHICPINLCNGPFGYNGSHS